jgi:uncharacterized membrane protein
MGGDAALSDNAGMHLARAGRVTSIDALRGAVMVLMALDHVRDFVHAGAMSFSPTDFSKTTTVLFLTRWVTHVCAPTFLFTAGLGAWFWGQRVRSRAALARFLVTRGLWLILLEVTVMRLASNFSVSQAYPVLLLVFWVIGASMVLVACAVWVPRWVLMATALGIIGLHNLLDGVRPEQFGAAAPAWTLLHQVGVFQAAGFSVLVGYPLIPWVAVLALGLACGPIFTRAPADRQRVLARMGIAACAGFLIVRAFNGYGDPAPWSSQATPTFTMLSFLNPSPPHHQL